VEDIAPRVVVALRPLERGDTIRASDVSSQPLDAALRGLQPIEEPEDAVGLELTRPVASGQPIDRRHLRRPILVQRGGMVTVISRAPGVRVRTTARALEDASLHDLVTVESPANRQRFTARVTGIQETAVYASGINVPADMPAGQPVGSSPNHGRTFANPHRQDGRAGTSTVGRNAIPPADPESGLTIRPMEKTRPLSVPVMTQSGKESARR
jgi:flagella basal body P-ring formation protein FlgA